MTAPEPSKPSSRQHPTQVLSCDPLRVFIFKEGLTRICTEKYTKPKAENLGLTYMHLTNYAVSCRHPGGGGGEGGRKVGGTLWWPGFAAQQP